MHIDETMTEPASLPELPLEMVHHILYDLWTDDKMSDLASCSLVCRAWSSQSRRHLFHKIQVTQSTESKFQDLLVFLKDHSCLAYLIQDITLSGRAHLQSELQYRLRVETTLIADILCQLPQICHVTLHYIRPMGTGTTSPAFTNLHLKTLTFREVGEPGDPYYGISDVVGALANVERLRFDNVCASGLMEGPWDDVIDKIRKQRVAHDREFQVNELDLVGCELFKTLFTTELLREYSAFQSLRILTIDNYAAYTISTSVKPLIQEIAPSLTHFRLYPMAILDPDIWPDVVLSKFCAT
ncbi:hypothetical protein C8Q75DRAFT_624711 [Abortiporus biennis]|nr:hypothetical protein C8Q75DRAFT_624711 [Abortiporus biennis]